MGVTGLWQLVSSVGRPIPLETLENKVLAIDISIWLNQAVKGFRDAQGQAQPNAHLLGLFHRICKLLFYKIKPVFVFDGSVPHLKKQTVELRKRNRQVMTDTIEKTAQKILTNMLAKEVVQASSSSRKPSSSPIKPSCRNASNKVQITDDIFWLPPLPESSNLENKNNNEVSSSSDDEMDLNPSFYDSVMEREFQNMDEIDVESEHFNNMPPDIKHEILCEMKERKKRRFFQQNVMPEESVSFSKYQINHLLKRRHLTKKLEDVTKELNAHAAGKLMAHLDGQDEAEMMKVASEDCVHTILIPKNKSEIKKKIEPESVIIPLEEKLNATNSKEDNIYFWEEFIDSPDYEGSDLDICEPLDIKSQSKLIVNSDCTEANETTKVTPKQITYNEKTENILTQKIVSGNTCFLDTEVKKTSQNQNLSFKDIEEIDSPPLISDKTDKSIIKSSDEIEFFIEESSNSDIECLSSPSKEGSVICATKKINDDQILLETKNNNIPSKGIEKDFNLNKECNIPIFLNLPIARDAAATADELFPIEIFEIQNKQSISKDDELFPLQVFQTGLENTVARIEKITTDIVNDVHSNEKPENIQETTEICDSSFSEENTKKAPENVLKKHITEDILGKLPLQNKNKKNHLDLQKHDPSNHEPDDPVLTLLSLSEEKRDILSDALDLERLEYIREQNKKERQAQTVSDQVCQESQDLLKLFGIPYVVSPTEAEAQCAQLELLGLTHGTITDDSDIWLFGGSKVYKNFFTQGKYLECYTNKDIENQFGLDRSLLVCFALLTGSDYTQGIEGVGPVRAMEIISEFKKEGLETLITFKRWWDESKKTAKAPGNNVRSKLLKLELPENFPQFQVYQAYLKPKVDESNEKFTWGLPNLDELRELAKEKFGWNQTKVDEMLIPIIKKVNERESQSRIDSFFNVTLKKEKNLFPSKRIQKALTKIKPLSQNESGDKQLNKKTKGQLTKKSYVKRKKADSSNNPSTSSSVRINLEVNLSEESSDSSDDFISKVLVTKTKSVVKKSKKKECKRK